MNIGALGDIPFVVSDSQVKTIRDLVFKNEASISVHSVHMDGGKAEFTGWEPQQIAFKCRLSAFLGVDVKTEKEKLEAAIKNGTQLKFTLGGEVMGRYRWLLKSCTMTAEYYDKKGRVAQYDAALTLLEYLK